MVTIEKDVPIPPVQKHSGRSKYRFNEMQVGDSIFIKGADLNSSPYQLARAYGRRFGQKFTGRNVEGGLRIWRIE